MNQYRCDKSCKWFDDSDEKNKIFDLIFCKKYQEDIEPIFRSQSELVGCASHSDFQSERDTISKELALELCIDARKDVRDKVLDDFACWIKTEWVQESIKDYKADKPCK
jgi:hypothetical protein